MSNSIDHFDFSKEHFDVLLNHALLSKEGSFTVNEKILDTMANQTFTMVNVKDIDENKGAQIIEKLTADFKRGNKFRLNIFLICLLISGTIASILFFNSHQKQNAIIPSTTNQTKNQISKLEALPSITAEELNSNPFPVINPAVLALIDSSDKIEIKELKNGMITEQSIPTSLHIPLDHSMHYEDIPTLSEEVKIQTGKDKLKMLKDIVNPKKKIFGNIPMGSTKVNGVIRSIQAFKIKNAEVSNFEYRTFLNDLLVQGKFEDYLLAATLKGQWKSIGIPEFENVYFESEKYNDFPAVNMTRKGAELYCIWLTKSMQTAIDKKEIKLTKDFPELNDFRLPYDLEWIYSARGGHDSLNIKYPWQYVGPNIYNARGCYLCNFNYTDSKIQLGNKADCPKQWNGKLPQGGFHRAIITTAGMAIDTLLTAPVYAYNPNDYGQYCMMGNVSEMVWTWNAETPNLKGAARSMGGSWNSNINNVQIEAPEQYVGFIEASPLIGFRPVMTAIKK